MLDRNGHTLQDAINKAREKEIRRVAREDLVNKWVALAFILVITVLVTVIAPSLDIWAGGR